MKTKAFKKLIDLDVRSPVWDRVFMVAPLVVIGSKEEIGYDLAPKHMAAPMGFDNFFGFVCTPEHKTYGNILKNGEFSVSFPKPDQLLMSSLAALPRCDSISKSERIVRSMPTFKGKRVDAPLLDGSYLFFECELFKVVDGFGANSLITGKIISAYADKDYVRQSEKDDQEMIYEFPLLAYLPYGRYAIVKKTFNYPFPKDFKR